jgi:hypothetical protein
MEYFHHIRIRRYDILICVQIIDAQLRTARTQHVTARTAATNRTKRKAKQCHRIRSVTEGPLSGATCPRFLMQKYAVYWPEGGAASQYSVFIGQ